MRQHNDPERRLYTLTHGDGEASTRIAYDEEEAWWPRFDTAMAARQFDNPPPHPFDAWIAAVHAYEQPPR